MEFTEMTEFPGTINNSSKMIDEREWIPEIISYIYPIHYITYTLYITRTYTLHIQLLQHQHRQSSS